MDVDEEDELSAAAALCCAEDGVEGRGEGLARMDLDQSNEEVGDDEFDHSALHHIGERRRCSWWRIGCSRARCCGGGWWRQSCRGAGGKAAGKRGKGGEWRLWAMAALIFFVLLLAATAITGWVLALTGALHTGDGGGDTSHCKAQDPLDCPAVPYTDIEECCFSNISTDVDFYETSLEIMAWKWAIEYGVTSAAAPDTHSLSFDRTYYANCLEDDAFLRMFTDPFCSSMWQRKAMFGDVKSMDEILAVVPVSEDFEAEDSEKMMQNGGMRFHVDDHFSTKIYFKPCAGRAGYGSGSGEDYRYEIVAFLMDRFAGFHRTAAVGFRNMPKNELYSLANDLRHSSDDNKKDERAKDKMDSTFEFCANDDKTAIPGAIVGWANFPTLWIVKHDDKKKYLIDFMTLSPDEAAVLRQTKFNIDETSSLEEKRFAVENSALNIWMLLTKFLDRYNHNVYALQSLHDGDPLGPFMYIDNDRTNLNKPVRENHVIKDYLKNHKKLPHEVLCKFPKRIGLRLLLLDPSNHQSGWTLGHLVYNSYRSLFDDVYPSRPIHSSEAEVLDDNVNFVATMIRNCIDSYGEDDVWLEEPDAVSMHAYSVFQHLSGE